MLMQILHYLIAENITIHKAQQVNLYKPDPCNQLC